MSTQEKVFKLVCEQVGASVGKVNLGSTVKSLGMDSMDEVELVMAVEEVFDLEVSDYECEKWTTVQSIIDYVKESI